MSFSKSPKNKCCTRRYVSCGINRKGNCVDICTEPLCGDPDCLTVLTPVVYDELGVNLCRSVPLESGSPQAESISVQVMDIQFENPPQSGTVPAAPIPGRPSCYLISLTNLTVTFFVTFYDCAKKVVDAQTVSAVYLPSDSGSPEYEYMDEDTNPPSAQMEIYAPYGIAHGNSAGMPGLIHTIGFGPSNTALNQGLNLIAIPKVLSYSPEEGSAAIGLSLLLKSVYFSQYRIPHNGRAVVPKACICPGDDTLCMDFVSGDLLDLAIKPLELGPPKYEEGLKNECDVPCAPCCSAQEAGDKNGCQPSAGD